MGGCLSFDFVPWDAIFLRFGFCKLHACHSLFSKMFLLQVLAAPHELEAEAPGRLSSCMCLVDLLLLFVSPVCEDVVGMSLLVS